eukprot:XP_014001257.1 PREDICTED: uncharacterized protein LOC106572048 [Salmo salar]
MTIKKSKTVVFERRAGDLTALYCMNDWMIAVVLAIITMMSVWAALIIYRYIQTERGKRRRKVDDDTILETEKDDNETRNEEEKILSRVESTEEGEEVVPETLESWDGEEWRREPMEWIPTTNEDVEPIEGISATTNEGVEPIEGIPTITNEDVEPIEGISATTNEGVEPIEGIPTITNEDVEPIEGMPTTNEGVEPIEGIPTTNEGVEPIEGIPTITIDDIEPITRIRTTTNEDLEPIKQIRARTNEDLQPIRRIRTLTNEDLEPIRRIRTLTNEDLEPIRWIRTATNEDLEPIRRIRTATNEDLQPIRRIRTTTNESDGPYTWESYAEWQIVEEFHLGSQPQQHCEGICQHYDGLCQVCGGLCHCSECLCQFYEGLCQDDAESQTDCTVDQEEQGSTSHYSLSDINYQSGHEKDTDVYNQDEEGLKEVELSDDCQCESTEEESEVNHPHAFAIKPQRDLEELNGNLPDMILTDSDLTEPDHVCYTEIQEVQYPDDDMTSHVAAEMILSGTDPTEPLPKHLCDTDKEEVECPEHYMNIHVNITPQEKRPDVILTNTDLTEPRPEHVCDTEIQEVEYTDDDMTSHVVFSNEPQEERPEMTLTDTEHVSDKEREEVEYPDDDRHSHVAFAKVQESVNLPEIEPEHVYEVEREEVGVEYPDEVITEGPEHLSENIPEILSDTDLQEPGNLCEEEIQEVECTSDYMDSQVSFVSDTQESEHPNEYLPDMILTDTKTKELDHVCDTEIQDVECPDVEANNHVTFDNEPQDENLPEVALSDTGHVCDSEIQEVEYPGADMTSHVPSVSERTVEDDMKEAMVEDLDMEAMVEDLWRKDCLLHDYVIDGLSQPTDVRDTHVAERKGDIVDNNSKDTRVEEEKKRQSDDTRIEESYEKVEINIMEATMDYNEWMTVSGTEDNSDSPWVSISHSSIECSSAVAEHHPTETHHNLDDPPVADATAFKEVKETGAKDGHLRRNKNMAAVLPVKPKTVRVRFCVHYRTQSPWQELAVTGNQQELGSWTGFVPLERAQDGFWASWVVLPAEKQVEWKLVLVEDGEILRWEEGDNRHLETGQGGGEVYLNKWWGSL